MDSLYQIQFIIILKDVACLLQSNSLASAFYMPTFRNTLCVPSSYSPMMMEQSVPKRRHIKFRRRGITQNKAYNIQNTAKFWNQESGLGTHCTGGWVGPRVGLNRCGNSRPHRDSISVSDRPLCGCNLHTGRSLTESTVANAVLIQFDLLMMSTVLLETCRGL